MVLAMVGPLRGHRKDSTTQESFVYVITIIQTPKIDARAKTVAGDG